MLSFSVTPEVDTPEVLRSYAETHHVTSERWSLLTGNRDAIYQMAEESYLVDLDDAPAYGVAQLAHTENVFLVDGGRRIRGVYNGTLPFDLQQLITDVELLLGEPPRDPP